MSNQPQSRSREATQEFVALDTIMGYTGQTLTPELVSKIAARYVEEFSRGPCAWAFSPVSETAPKIPAALAGYWTPSRCLSLGEANELDALCKLLNGLQYPIGERGGRT